MTAAANADRKCFLAVLCFRTAPLRDILEEEQPLDNIEPKRLRTHKTRQIILGVQVVKEICCILVPREEEPLSLSGGGSDGRGAVGVEYAAFHSSGIKYRVSDLFARIDYHLQELHDDSFGSSDEDDGKEAKLEQDTSNTKSNASEDVIARDPFLKTFILDLGKWLEVYAMTGPGANMNIPARPEVLTGNDCDLNQQQVLKIRRAAYALSVQSGAEETNITRKAVGARKRKRGSLTCGMKSKVLSSSHVFSCLSSWHNVQNSLADYLASSSSSEQVRRALYRTLDEVFSANVVPELNAQIPSGKFKNIDDCVANLVVKYYGNTRNVITKIGPEEENETLQESASDRMVERTAKLRNLAVEAASIASGKTQGTSATEKAALILKRLELLLQKGMKIDDIISGKSRRERKLAFSI